LGSVGTTGELLTRPVIWYLNGELLGSVGTTGELLTRLVIWYLNGELLTRLVIWYLNGNCQMSCWLQVRFLPSSYF